MRKGKSCSAYLNHDHITRLDTIRGNLPRSAALSSILSYILAQPDDTILAILGIHPQSIPSPTEDESQQTEASGI